MRAKITWPNATSKSINIADPPKHSEENMVAEVTLHNNIEMSKSCPKIAQNCPKLPKVAQNYPKLTKNDKNCLKLKGYLSNYTFHTVLEWLIVTHT